MMKMRRCIKCGKFTLKTIHCGVPTVLAHPPRFNPHDPYGKYRRKAKGME